MKKLLIGSMIAALFVADAHAGLFGKLKNKIVNRVGISTQKSAQMDKEDQKALKNSAKVFSRRIESLCKGDFLLKELKKAYKKDLDSLKSKMKTLVNFVKLATEMSIISQTSQQSIEQITAETMTLIEFWSKKSGVSKLSEDFYYTVADLWKTVAKFARKDIYSGNEVLQICDEAISKMKSSTWQALHPGTSERTEYVDEKYKDQNSSTTYKTDIASTSLPVNSPEPSATSVVQTTNSSTQTATTSTSTARTSSTTSSSISRASYRRTRGTSTTSSGTSTNSLFGSSSSVSSTSTSMGVSGSSTSSTSFNTAFSSNNGSSGFSFGSSTGSTASTGTSTGVSGSSTSSIVNPLLIKYAPAMGQLEAIAGAKPSTPPQDSKTLLKRFAEVLEVDESMLRYEDRLGAVHLIDISDLIRASLMNSDPNAQLLQTFMNSCSKKLVSIGIGLGWLSKPSNDQSVKAFNWIRSQVNKGIREYKFDTSQRALAKRKLIAARPWNDNSGITEKSITETINKANNQLKSPDPKYIKYAKALGLLEAIAGAKPSTPPPSDQSLLKRFADILGINVNLLFCSTDYYSSGICFRNIEEQIMVNQSISPDKTISTLYNNYSKELAKVGIYTIHYGTPSKEAFDVLRSQSKQGLTGYTFNMSSEAMKKRKEIALRPWDNTGTTSTASSVTSSATPSSTTSTSSNTTSSSNNGSSGFSFGSSSSSTTSTGTSTNSLFGSSSSSTTSTGTSTNSLFGSSSSVSSTSTSMGVSGSSTSSTSFNTAFSSNNGSSGFSFGSSTGSTASSGTSTNSLFGSSSSVSSTSTASTSSSAAQTPVVQREKGHMLWDEWVASSSKGSAIFDDEEELIYAEELKYLIGKNVSFPKLKKLQIKGEYRNDGLYINTSNGLIKGLAVLCANAPNLEDLTVNYGLSGIPTSEICKLKKLTSLNLSDNSLTSLPREIGQLTNLKTLVLKNNQITTLPNEIGGLKNLITLDLYKNQLTTLPAGIGGLTNLTSLDLSCNRKQWHFSDNGYTYNCTLSLPNEIGNLTNLTTLNLRDNDLTTLPNTIGNLTNLKTLNLNNNSELTTLPNTIGNLKNLTSLDLSGCRLTSLPEGIGSLTNLRTLNVGNSFYSSNQLTSIPNTIGNLRNLTSLTLNSNKLTSIPNTIGNLRNLTTLNLSYNKITILPQEIRNLVNLTSLNVSNNQLTSLPGGLENLTKLPSLNISHNQIAELPEGIGKLTNITTLDVGYNKLTSLPNTIGNLTNLTSLYVDHNQISSIPNTIGNLKKLSYLNVTGNQLTGLPNEIGNLTNLRTLYMYDNRLTNIPSTIGNLTRLNRITIDERGKKYLPQNLQSKVQSVTGSIPPR